MSFAFAMNEQSTRDLIHSQCISSLSGIELSLYLLRICAKIFPIKHRIFLLSPHIHLPKSLYGTFSQRLDGELQKFFQFLLSFYLIYSRVSILSQPILNYKEEKGRTKNTIYTREFRCGDKNHRDKIQKEKARSIERNREESYRFTLDRDTATD